jgi:hypothetical protein
MEMTEATLLSTAELAEIEARANAATEGPWTCELAEPWADDPSGMADDGYLEQGFDVIGPRCVEDPEYGHSTGAEAAFIAHSRTDIPRLLADRRALQTELAELRGRGCEGCRWARERALPSLPLSCLFAITGTSGMWVQTGNSELLVEHDHCCAAWLARASREKSDASTE